jgi:A/G-specific adenine glycosylase
MSEFRIALLGWYAREKRDLPWRRTRDPYSIWVSEVMLQQTQVKTALPYYVRWMERFPSVEALASADEQEALSLWEGLGYYRRCRLLLAGARWVARNGIPQSALEWRRVPGVGAYTAGAIASICHDEPAAAVDGNVKRVFARLELCEGTGAALERACWSWASPLVPSSRPGDWNQALMELGGRVCKPRNPSCGACPVSEHCKALEHGAVHLYPRAAAKEETVEVAYSVVVPVHERSVGLRQIAKGEWWEGMWSFPRTHEAPAGQGIPLPEIRHVVTKHRVRLTGELRVLESRHEGLRWTCEKEIAGLPMPAPHRKLLGLAYQAMK